MEGKKIIAICQSGGVFGKKKDDSLSYSGGEAYAVDIDEHTQLSDFKTEIAEIFNCSIETMTLKYFLPGNKKTLITISKDRDLKRMVNFTGESLTVDVFIILNEPAARNVSTMPASRSSRTTVSKEAVPIDEPVGISVETTNANDPPASSIDNVSRKAAQQWENTITGIDQRFNSLSDFREALHKYSIAHGFSYRFKKNETNRVSVKCKFQGCPWRIYASKLSTTQLLCIKKMNANHTCDRAVLKIGCRHSRRWVGNIIKEKVKVSPNYKPKDIAEDIKREYGIQLDYSQAWRAKLCARKQLRGFYKEAYNQLPYVCNKIKETSPGSFATIETKEDSSFHRLFISFYASISGFRQGCRPLLFLNTNPLNSKYQGVLLAATAADADDGEFPVAFAVVDAETEENWYWFLKELKSAVKVSQPITFVSDFQNGLKQALAEIFDKCHHSYCMRHLSETLDKNLTGQFSHEVRRFLINDVYAAAYAPRIEAFRHSIENIKGISLEAYNLVIQSEPEHWASALFVGARYNNISSNFGQQFYEWLSEGPELVITQMIDALQEKMMESINARLVESSQWMTKLTPSNEDKLEKEISLAKSLQVLHSHGRIFEVRGESFEIVDIDSWDCSCRRWKLTGLPCRHAIAVLECLGRSPYEYCSKYFTVESYRSTYAESTNPVPDLDRPIESESTPTIVTVTPPPTRQPSDRPKTKPVEPHERQCSKCRGFGHYKKTCDS